jgi:hypothetical protein
VVALRPDVEWHAVVALVGVLGVAARDSVSLATACSGSGSMGDAHADAIAVSGRRRD